MRGEGQPDIRTDEEDGRLLVKRCESGGTGTRPLKGKRHLKLRFKHDENNFSSIKINVLLRPQKLDECITSQLPWCPWGEALLRGSWAETQAPPPPAPTDTATTWRGTHDHAGAPPDSRPPARTSEHSAGAWKTPRAMEPGRRLTAWSWGGRLDRTPRWPPRSHAHRGLPGREAQP